MFSTPAGPRKGAWSRKKQLAVSLAGLGLRLSGLYGFGERSALDVRRTEVRLELPGLPGAFDGYRILLLADPHLDALPGLADAICAAVRGCRVDLAVFNGDYQFHYGADFAPLSRSVERIVQAIHAADGMVALLGNHDRSSDVQFLERAGLRALLNETAIVARGGERLLLTGLDDVNMFLTPGAIAELRRPKGLGGESFGIALVHSPEVAALAAQSGYGLYLSGHTHGGQICMPGGAPLVTGLYEHRSLGRRGVWQCGGMTGFTSFGAGVSTLPVRYFSHGEVTVLTLAKC